MRALHKMWARLTLIALLLGLFSVPLATSGLPFTQLVVEEFQVSPPDIYPGDNVTVRAVLWNGVREVYHVQTQLKIEPGDPFVCISPTLIPVGNLEFDERATVEYHLRVSEDAEPKSYSLTLEISHIGIKHSTQTKTRQVTTREDNITTTVETTPIEMVTLWSYTDVVVTETIPVEVKDIANALLTTRVTPVEVLPGQRLTISAIVDNTGSAVAREVTAQLKVGAEDPFVPLTPTLVSLGHIEPKGKARLSYSLLVSGSAKAQPYTLQIVTTYLDRYRESVSETESVPIVVKDIANAHLVARDLLVTPVEVLPGQRLTISAIVENTGSAVAREVTAQLNISPEHPFVPLTPTLVSLGDIEPNEVANWGYSLLVSGSAKAQPYTLQIVLSYIDRYRQPVTEAESVAVPVHSIASFRLLNLPELTAEPGETVTIDADLLLVGTETVRFVEVGLAGNRTGPFVITLESHEYVGQVDPDSPVPFTIEFSIDPDARPGSYSGSVEVTYWDEYNIVKRIALDVPITVEEAIKRAEGEKVGYTFWDLLKMTFGVRP